ncbi:DUF4238 domain-containing protein [Streptomyces sp. NPDC046900]|uniref:DUF4238 domain-containing protein n=1 Tax=Streptomyces sp. NPDC046900 TaxID=3155473 RepID=UPI0033EAE712
MGKNTGKQKLKRRHHTVPRLLLRRFADGERLVRVPLNGGEPTVVGVGDVTVRRDFYSMRTEDGQLDDTVEDLLSNLESQAAQVIRKIIEDQLWPLPVGDRAILGQWIAAQHVRIPAVRQANNEIFDQLTKIVIAAGGKPEMRRLLEEEAGEPVTDEEVDAMWAEMTDFTSYDAELSANDHMLMMGRSMETAYDAMMNRSWGLCRFQRKTLLLSDHPVTLMRDEHQPEWRGVGLANAAAILVPIDRRAAIIMEPPGVPDHELPASAKVAREMNHRFAWNSRIELFHHPDDNPLVGIELPPVRSHEAEFSQTAENFVRPDGLTESA